jgi:hypothetical protein
MNYVCAIRVHQLAMMLLMQLFWFPLTGMALTPRPVSRNVDSSRRSFFGGAAAIASFWGSLSPNVLAAPATIAGRFDKDVLNLPAPYALEFNGVDNTYFPSFLEGEWDTTQTLLDTSAPLGLKYIGGPNGLVSIAEASMEQARSKIGKPVEVRLRYLPTKWGVAEDRLFNYEARLNSFAEKKVVATVAYADVGASNRRSVLTMGGTEKDPLQTVLVYFKGPVAQKSFVVSHGAENLGSDSWAGYELQRSIFALTNQNTAPPITTDSEYIWKFDKLDDDHIQGKLRIAEYLNANSDTLYFDARNRAVSLQDYTLDMRRHRD